MNHHRITRRSFIRTAAGASASLTALAGLALPAAAASGSKPRFRFLQINDTHINAEPFDAARHYVAANDKFRWIMDTINREKQFPLPDFVIHVGDVVHGGSESAIQQDFAALRTMLDLRCPLYPAVGNHDNRQQEGSATLESSYAGMFGDTRRNYGFDHQGIHFIVLNNSGAPASNDTPAGLARNQWLRDRFAAATDKPKILCCHIPLVPIREDAVLARSFGYPSYKCHDAQLIDLVRNHADTTIAVLSGHLHLTGVVQSHGVYHIVPSGSASDPCDYGALYEVYQDRIDVRMCSIPAELAARQAPGSIRGTCIHAGPRHPIDYTDASHPTPEAYQRGNPDERTFTIPLRGLKRPSWTLPRVV